MTQTDTWEEQFHEKRLKPLVLLEYNKPITLCFVKRKKTPIDLSKLKHTLRSKYE